MHMLNAVAAYWGLNSPDWAVLGDPNRDSTLGVVVAEGSISGLVAGDANALADAKQKLEKIPGVVLGYAFPRTGGGAYDDLLPAADVVAAVDGWYANLGDYIDGIYFDNGVMPGDALDQQTYQQPAMAWHTENAVISPSDPVLEAVTLRAQTPGGFTNCPQSIADRDS